MQSDDEIVDIELSSKRLQKMKSPSIKACAKEMKKIKARMVKIQLPTGEFEYLLTNLYDTNEFSTKEIGKLYYKRWEIEKAYDVIKNKLNIENISGRKKLIVEQDFYAQMLVFNMAEDLRRDANNKVEDSKKSTLKYDYKVNMNILVGTFREYLIRIFLEENSEKSEQMYKYMIDEITRSLIPIRPGRSNARKPYSGLNKHRTNLRRNS